MSDAQVYLLNAIRSDVKALELIGQNVANANSHGFKAGKIEGQRFNDLVSFDPEQNLQRGMDITRGTLSKSQSSDLVSPGQRFFVVQSSNTQAPVLSGFVRLNVDEKGLLIDGLGRQILGEGGPIYTSTGDVKVDEQGMVFDGKDKIGKLRQVQLTSLTAVKVDAQGNVPLHSNRVEELADGKVMVGYVEKSNVDVAEQMIKLMQYSRHLQTNQKVMQYLNSMLESGINDIGNRN